jgi:hypothetical protein
VTARTLCIAAGCNVLTTTRSYRGASRVSPAPVTRGPTYAEEPFSHRDPS